MTSTVPAAPALATPAPASHASAAIHCPFPARIHPYAEAVDARTLRWAEGFTIPVDARHRARLAAARPGLLTARVVPDGPLPQVQVFTDFHTWLFAFDDDHCDGAGERPSVQHWGRRLAVLARVAESGDTGPAPDDPYALALADVSRRIAQHSSAAQFTGWANAVQEYLATLLWERVRRTGSAGPSDLDGYVLLRLRNGGMRSSIALLDMAAGYEVPCEQRCSAPVRALAEMSALLVSWDNDLFSRHKEATVDGSEENLVDVLAATVTGDIATAELEAVRLRNRVTRLFLDLRAAVLSRADRELARYVDALAGWVRANLDFSAGSPRYAYPGRPQPPAAWPGQGQARDAGPPPCPSLAWWWEVLDAVRAETAPTSPTSSDSPEQRVPAGAASR
ncbi:terpene synthase family protein [Streptomyces sp. TLI_171]|uniref:terpene synthase family protein n=1 Tax=Streptomyces sp. TLI_171 TaxID=1938859 RepID=UPI000FF7BC97|nr:terpene synthase [Streptomyces sp. TLI_171]RKE22145.1 hypothetical protein BX266_5576 [Streptomyces sp. TLI_171]